MKANRERRILDLIQHASVLCCVSYNPAASDFALADFKLRLYQRNAIAPVDQTRPNRRKDLGQRDKRDVDSREVEETGELFWIQAACVHAFKHDYPCILSQP